MHLSTPEVGPEPPGSSPEGNSIAPTLNGGSGKYIRSGLRAIIVALVIGAVLFLVVRDRTQSPAKAAQAPIPRLSATPILRLKGTTEAVRMRTILTPVLAGQYVATLTVTKLTAAGTNVKRADLLAEFDDQAQKRDSIDKQADYDKLVNQVVEEQAKEDIARAKDDTEIKEAEDSLSKAQLEIQKVELMSRIDAEKANQDLVEAQATLAQLRETFVLKRKAARAAIRILEIQRDRTRQIMLHARADAELMQIRAPLDGVVVLNTIWKQGQMGEVKEGDQLRPGIPFMEVVDPSLMEVRVLANQEDFLSLQVGQSAQVHLDAYPELVFPGRLEEMAPIGRSGDFSSQLRTFTVLFSVTGRDAMLMPDLSAAVDVDIAEQQRVGKAPR
jgi:HlyD family secretion protein